MYMMYDVEIKSCIYHVYDEMLFEIKIVWQFSVGYDDCARCRVERYTSQISDMYNITCIIMMDCLLLVLGAYNIYTKDLNT